MARFVRIGNVRSVRGVAHAVSNSSRHVRDPEGRRQVGIPVDGVVIGRVSQAALNRMTRDPSYYISSGALFVDTDGRRVQDGDDF